MVRPPYEFQFFLLKAYFIIIFSKSSCPSQGVTLSLLVVQACVLGRSVVSDSASRQTSLSQMPQITAPYSLGGTAQLPKRLQVSQGTVLVTWKPSNKHTGGEPLLTASDGPAAAPSASQRQLMHASRYLPQLIKSKMRGCGPILVLAGVRGRCSHNSITNTSWPTATTRRAD